jgi:hypothetical protein
MTLWLMLSLWTVAIAAGIVLLRARRPDALIPEHPRRHRFARTP